MSTRRRRPPEPQALAESARPEVVDPVIQELAERDAICTASQTRTEQARTVVAQAHVHMAEGRQRAEEAALAVRAVRKRLEVVHASLQQLREFTVRSQQIEDARISYTVAERAMRAGQEVLVRTSSAVNAVGEKIRRTLTRIGDFGRRLWRCAQAANHHVEAQDREEIAQLRVRQARTNNHRTIEQTENTKKSILLQHQRLAHLHSLNQRAVNIAVQVKAAQQRMEDVQQDVESSIHSRFDAIIDADRAKQRIAAQSAQICLVRRVASGLAYGLSRYLARATPQERAIVLDMNGNAQADGAQRAGSRPRISVDQRRAEAKARRATKARERRQRAKAGIQPEKKDCEVSQRRRASAAHTLASQPPDPRCDGSRPEIRQHEARMQEMDPASRGAYLAHLISAREMGRAAAARDAALIGTQPTSQWKCPMAAVALGPGARLIAVLGAVDRDATIAGILSDPAAIDHFLEEPALARNAAYGTSSRLEFGAGHVVAAWSPTLAQLAIAGDLDLALAHEVALFQARFDLVGHRVLGILHLDSATGHPHLHIIFSRARNDDLSLWSLSSRERAPALWLHARSRTAQLLGSEALSRDVDALAGMATPARAGELLMGDDMLTIQRRSISGETSIVRIQGLTAALRITQVGASSDQQLAGGIWRFGLGADPEKNSAWLADLKAAKASGERHRIAAVMQQKPHKRGYWLATKALENEAAFKKSSGFGDYLARVSV